MMSFRTILTVLNGRNGDAASLETAYAVASMTDSHIDVMHVRPDPRGYVDFTGDAMTGNAYVQLIESLEEEIAENAKAARASFDAWVADAGIAVVDGPGGSGQVTATWRERTGAEDKTIAGEARLRDLVILSATGEDGDSVRDGAIEKAIFDSGRPLLLTPRDAGLKKVGRAAVFWNGGTQAARAVAAALPLLHEADAVDVMWVDEDVEDDFILTGLIDYLAWHGISASVKRFKPDERLIGELLMDEAVSGGADVVVMGGYSHSRLREFILGGVTQHMLDESPLPALIAH
jgi:nucleotide-binding universal stress UspA family protein